MSVSIERVFIHNGSKSKTVEVQKLTHAHFIFQHFCCMGVVVVVYPAPSKGWGHGRRP